MELNKKCVNCENEVMNDSDLCEECHEDTIDWEDYAICMRVDEYVAEQQDLREKEREEVNNGN